MKLKVLLVEDLRIPRILACLTLKDLGCKVDIAIKGQEALELTDKNQYDLILMDLGLPDEDGITVTKMIRRSDKAQKRNVPIVALTANTDESTRQNCLKSGMNDFIPKPLTKDKAEKLINRLRT